MGTIISETAARHHNNLDHHLHILHIYCGHHHIYHIHHHIYRGHPCTLNISAHLINIPDALRSSDKHS